MTIDNAITIFHGFECNPLFSEKHFKAFDIAIKSLEAWEKVRAEIEDYKEKYIKLHHDWDATMIQGYDDALMVIDKHMQEVTE